MKREELLEHMSPLLPADFFTCRFSIPECKDFSIPLQKAGEKVPEMSELLVEEKFASLFLSWNEEGLLGRVIVDKPFESSFFPDFEKGDALELFIDTRDHKKKGFASRFCHRFVFLPAEVNGIQAQEITKFRSEDTHPLCEASDLMVSSTFEKTSYTLFFQIKTNALCGYDPGEFDRIGFAYSLHRFKGKPQQFPTSAAYFDLAQSPKLWASVLLK
jgi:hypothetical protein